jgi:hypothetical protein
MTALDAQRLVDGGQDSVGGVSSSSDVCVGEDRQQLGRRATQDSGGVNVAHRSGKGRCHRLERFFRRTTAVGLDQQDSEVALISVGSSELILQHGPDEAIVEEAGGAVDNMERFGLGVVGLDAA